VHKYPLHLVGENTTTTAGLISILKQAESFQELVNEKPCPLCCRSDDKSMEILIKVEPVI